MAGALVIGFAVAGRAARGKAARLAGLTAIAYAGSVLLAAPYLLYSLRHFQGALTRQEPEFSLQFVRLIVPTSFADVQADLADRYYSNHLGRGGIDDYVGIPLLVILLLLAVFAWSNRVSRLLAVGFVLVLALAAGPVLCLTGKRTYTLPWSGLWTLPIARSAEPARFIVFALLALAIALALFLAAPGRNKLLLAARWGLALLAVAAVITDTPTSYQSVTPLPPNYKAPATLRAVNQLPAFLTEGLYRQYPAPGGDRRGAHPPRERRDAVPGQHQLLLPDRRRVRQRVPDAGKRRSAPGHAGRSPERGVADRMLADYLRSAGVGAILVEQAWEDPWMRNLSTRLGMRGTSAGGVTVYPVAPWLASLPRQAELSQQAHQKHQAHQSHQAQLRQHQPPRA